MAVLPVGSVSVLMELSTNLFRAKAAVAVHCCLAMNNCLAYLNLPKLQADESETLKHLVSHESDSKRLLFLYSDVHVVEPMRHYCRVKNAWFLDFPYPGEIQRDFLHGSDGDFVL